MDNVGIVLIARLLSRIRRDPDLGRLERQGLRVGERVKLGRQVYIGSVCPWLISIGDDTVVGMNAIILSHDNSMKRHIGYTRVAPVKIGRRVYIGAGAIVLPGVEIGDDAVVGAGAVVSQDVPGGTVVAGSPAKAIGTTQGFVAQHEASLNDSPRFATPNDITGPGYVR